jgi:ABC-type multidrug transport system ATPase subunit
MGKVTSQRQDGATAELLWTLRDVSLRGQNAPRLDRVSLTIPAGRVALLGVSGAGKSSLLRILAGFETPDSGTVIRHEGVMPSSLPVFWSPQDYGLWPHLTVREHLEHARPADSRTANSVENWLQQFRLETLADSQPGALSEGEQSRLSVVRALASEADVILLDEPLAHVDPVHREDDWRTVMSHVEEFCRGVVFSTHEPAIVRRFADVVVSLHRGRIQFAGSTSQLLFSPPDESAAWLLGPCNWLDDKCRQWFPDTEPSWPCLRPEETSLSRDSAGEFRVASVEAHGTGARFELQHVEQDSTLVVYATHNPEVQPDSRVRINVTASPDRK